MSCIFNREHSCTGETTDVSLPWCQVPKYRKNTIFKTTVTFSMCSVHAHLYGDRTVFGGWTVDDALDEFMAQLINESTLADVIVRDITKGHLTLDAESRLGSHKVFDILTNGGYQHILSSPVLRAVDEMLGGVQVQLFNNELQIIVDWL